MIRLYNISKIYHSWRKFGAKTVALKDINLEIESGVFGLLGPNGAGKTTMMRIIATVLSPTTGKVWYKSEEITKNPEAMRKVLGYLPQEFGFYPYWTAEETLAYFAYLKGITDKARIWEIERAIELAGLQENRKRWVRALSGGMKKRLGIAQALLGNPEVLIVDEPTAGLDPEERVKFRLLLESLGLEATVILSTHIVEDLSRACREIAILLCGQIIRKDSIEGLLKEVEGKVWEGEIPPKSTYKPRAGERVVNIRSYEKGLIVRVVAKEKPGENFSAVNPTLEDAYLAILEQSHSFAS